MISILKSTLSLDLSLDLEGYYVTAQDSFLDALKTSKGSVICNPDYGTIFHTLKHRSFNGAWIIDFKRCLKDACIHDPRLIFKSASVTQIGNKIEFKVSLENDEFEGFFNV